MPYIRAKEESKDTLSLSPFRRPGKSRQARLKYTSAEDLSCAGDSMTKTHVTCVFVVHLSIKTLSLQILLCSEGNIMILGLWSISNVNQTVSIGLQTTSNHGC